MGKTKIEWCDFSINPIRARLGFSVGHYCEKLSQGCKNCYSSRLQPRFQMPQFTEQLGKVKSFLDASKLEEVLRRKKPTRYFWCDMTDMFGDWVPFEWIAACFGVMAATPWHTHLMLTKRPHRMREWFEWITQEGRHVLGGDCEVRMCLERTHSMGLAWDRHIDYPSWPLPNVHLGVSCENQQTADERIPLLLECPAAVRFISAEPLLGPIDLRHLPFGSNEPRSRILDALTAGFKSDTPWHLNWVIAGSESGPGARPMELAWIESLRDQCAAAGVAFFAKQIANEHDRKGGNPEHWPGGPWPREFPEVRQ